MDKIGLYKGKGISTMTHEELLDFASWAAKRIEYLQKRLEDLGYLDLGRLSRPNRE